MNIYVLEDDFFQRTKFERLIKEILHENKWSVGKIFSTSKPREILENVQPTNCPNIYFLDIELKNSKTKGLEIAREIRQLDSYGTITFITSHLEFAPITYQYKVAAFGFIHKKLDEDKFKSELYHSLYTQLYTNPSSTTEEFFVFKNKSADFKIQLSDILYFETSEIPHKIKLVCKSKVLFFYEKLSVIQNLHDAFYQCHRSYVVNLHNICEINRKKKQILLNNGANVLVARAKSQELAKRLTQYQK